VTHHASELASVATCCNALLSSTLYLHSRVKSQLHTQSDKSLKTCHSDDLTTRVLSKRNSVGSVNTPPSMKVIGYRAFYDRTSCFWQLIRISCHKSQLLTRTEF